jgi:hypothetical protein
MDRYYADLKSELDQGRVQRCRKAVDSSFRAPPYHYGAAGAIDGVWG